VPPSAISSNKVTWTRAPVPASYWPC